MSNITVKNLDEKKNELENILDKYHLDLSNICAYGFVCHQHTGATCDLNLLVKQDEFEGREALEKELSGLFNAKVSVDTLTTLSQKPTGLLGMRFTISEETVNTILNQCEPLDQLITQAEQGARKTNGM